MAVDKHRQVMPPPALPTSVSAAFRAGSDPKELKRGLTDLARHAEASTMVIQTHWEKLVAIEQSVEEIGDKVEKDLEATENKVGREQERLESNIIVLDGKQSKLELRIQKLEIRIALYAAGGTIFGAAVAAVLMKLVFK